ncbi:MAG TPA: pyrroline-5-carboxylate reductase [Burkholderiaceae bacterium]|nr:pyrroline-5-carboxylate reductase [Burkholderiaceae bacterium]HQR78535.1 pyrroline-5-carboxylate reductase [Burkholderiaceae bacterium]
MNLAFIGGGNMAHAMLGGMQAAGMVTASMHVLEPDAAKGAELAQAFGVTAHEQPGDWLHAAEVIVLAIKPQYAREAVAAVVPFLGAPLTISIIAGVRGATLARWLGHQRIVRAMPNTPALIRAGITGAVALPEVSSSQHDRADRILRSIGKVLWFKDEAMLDPVNAISGSGPGYVFYFIEALQQAARELGLPEEQGRLLAVETFLGAARLAEHSRDPVALLRERVTSKGGTTAAALARFESDGVRAGIVAGVRAACERAAEMGRQFDADSPQKE